MKTIKKLFLETVYYKFEFEGYVNKAVVICVIVMVPLILAGAAYAQYINHHVSH